MTSDDPFGGLLDRETVLAGLPARRANTLLYLIESRTAHLVARSREAMELFLSEENAQRRSEEHTSELQSRQYLVCRLLLEKKKLVGQQEVLAPHPERRVVAPLRHIHPGGLRQGGHEVLQPVDDRQRSHGRPSWSRPSPVRY